MIWCRPYRGCVFSGEQPRYFLNTLNVHPICSPLLHLTPHKPTAHITQHPVSRCCGYFQSDLGVRESWKLLPSLTTTSQEPAINTNTEDEATITMPTSRRCVSRRSGVKTSKQKRRCERVWIQASRFCVLQGAVHERTEPIQAAICWNDKSSQVRILTALYFSWN